MCGINDIFRYARSLAFIHPFQGVPEGYAPKKVESKQEKGRHKIQETEDPKQERNEGTLRFLSEEISQARGVLQEENNQRNQRNQRRAPWGTMKSTRSTDMFA